MNAYTYSILLTSDAEPGTGLGGESVNELIPRDHENQPTVRASHVKGLMREAVATAAKQFGWDEELETRVFGASGRESDVDATIRLTDATANEPTRSRFVTRTRLGDDGVAVDKTLRTTECLPIGTQFVGQLYSSSPRGSVEDLAWRFALRSIPAIGGGRNRGCGQCVIEIGASADDDSQTGNGGQAGGDSQAAAAPETPGELLKALHDRLRDDDWKVQTSADRAASSTLAATHAVLRLTFEAETPICCPEIPDKTNVIRSGFSIPASAVQGVILHRINQEHPALADKLFACGQFRAWPLHPVGYVNACQKNGDGEEPTSADVAAAIRVSLTHRAKKFSLGEKELGPDDFQDEAIAAYDWTEASRGAPLKASDGVLLVGRSSRIRLWPAGSMPRTISSHGVHNDPGTGDGRNLFTVDAMAPLRWQGIVVLPENVADQLQKSLQANPVVAVGKSRTVRGTGRLTAVRVADERPIEWQNRTGTDEPTVLVAQSPLLIESPDATESAESQLARLVRRWSEENSLGAVELKNQWANAGIRFGWNRTTQRGRLDACKVFLPGTVIAFTTRLDDAALAALQHGIGGGRERGYGAVSVHPGKATCLFKQTAEIPTLEPPSQSMNQQGAIQAVLAIARSTTQLPSPAQIRAVQQRVKKDGQDKARTYLKRQMEERPARIWFTWEPIMNQTLELLDPGKHNQTDAAQALALLADLSTDRTMPQ